MEITRDFVDRLRGRLTEKLNFLQVVIGPRQVGKTTGVEQIIRHWSGPHHMASADAVSPPSANWIEFEWERARRLGDGTLLVLDEIQKIHGWSEVVKKLFDRDRKKRNLKVVLLGSASLSLQHGLSESLAGRFETIHVGHWTLAECRIAFGWDLAKYLCFGGYPAAAELSNDIPRWQSFMKESIIEPVLARDIQGLAVIQKPALFRQTFELAMHYPAQEISLQKLMGQLQDSGNITTVKYYLELFQSAFLLRALQKYSGRQLIVRTSSPKLLPLSPALIHSFTDPRKVDTDAEWKGRIIESAIGSHLSQTEGKLFYWRHGKFEVDYVVEIDQKLFAIEVKSGRKRNALKGLEAFKERFPHCIFVMIDSTSTESFLAEPDIDRFLLSHKK